MCQICQMKEVVAKDRWPNPVEAHKKDLNFLIETVHDDYTSWHTNTPSSPTPESLLEVLQLLSSQLDALEIAREQWWTSPEKRAMRQRLDEDCNQKKLSDLHKINNTTVCSIESLEAKLGQFIKWALGMTGGVWELRNSHKVAA